MIRIAITPAAFEAIAATLVDLHERLIQMPPPLRIPAHV